MSLGSRAAASEGGHSVALDEQRNARGDVLYINNEQAYSKSQYIANESDDITGVYEDAVEGDSASGSRETSASESDVSSESSEDEVDDDTFDYYKQHEAFKDIMATKQRDWHNEAMIIQKEYGTTS